MAMDLFSTLATILIVAISLNDRISGMQIVKSGDVKLYFVSSACDLGLDSFLMVIIIF